MSATDEMLSRHLRVRPESNTAGVLRLVIWTGMQLLKAEEGSLLVVDGEADGLRFAMTVGNDVSEKTLLGQRVPFGSGWTGKAAATREVQVGAPLYADINQAERAEGGSGPEAVIAAPMVVDDRLVGVITAVSFEKGRRFDGDAARQFGAFAVIGAIIVDQEQRLAQLEETGGILGSLAEPDGRQVKDLVMKIAMRHPASLPDVIGLLQNVERLARGGS